MMIGQPAAGGVPLGMVTVNGIFGTSMTIGVPPASRVKRSSVVSQGADGAQLTKSGGIRKAHRMIHAARALGLKVMLGCMNESSLGIAEAAAIAPLVDVVDLDGHLLNANDAFTGLGLDDGRVIPGDGPGLGVSPVEQWP